MKVSKKFDKRYDINWFRFIRNYGTPNKIESIWKHKISGQILLVNWNSKSSYFIFDEELMKK